MSESEVPDNQSMEVDSNGTPIAGSGVLTPSEDLAEQLNSADGGSKHHGSIVDDLANQSEFSGFTDPEAQLSSFPDPGFRSTDTLPKEGRYAATEADVKFLFEVADPSAITSDILKKRKQDTPLPDLACLVAPEINPKLVMLQSLLGRKNKKVHINTFTNNLLKIQYEAQTLALAPLFVLNNKFENGSLTAEMAVDLAQRSAEFIFMGLRQNISMGRRNILQGLDLRNPESDRMCETEFNQIDPEATSNYFLINRSLIVWLLITQVHSKLLRSWVKHSIGFRIMTRAIRVEPLDLVFIEEIVLDDLIPEVEHLVGEVPVVPVRRFVVVDMVRVGILSSSLIVDVAGQVVPHRQGNPGLLLQYLAMLPSVLPQLDVIVKDLRALSDECHTRKFIDIAKWSDELLFNLSSAQDESEASTSDEQLTLPGSSKYRFVSSCFDCREFNRVVHALPIPQSDQLYLFLALYAKLLAAEKQRLDNLADTGEKNDIDSDDYLNDLADELTSLKEIGGKSFDSWLLYIHGLVSMKRSAVELAESCFLESLEQNPSFWGCWLELVKLVKTKDHLDRLNLPDHWMKRLFLIEVSISLNIGDEAMVIANEFVQIGFQNSLYIKQLIGQAYHAMQNLDSTIEVLSDLHKQDPFRLQVMDLYSNTLFVKNKRVELAKLAHEMFDVNKFIPETCCVVGNYFSLRGEHERSIQYFQRALRLDPENSGAWTLMGHEFLELQNHSAAILAYRKATEINPKDFRPWYGLGQNYEIMKMFGYALYYYNIGHKLRPQDSRLIVALGEIYEKMSRYSDAVRCYWKAHCVGDLEGLALVKLGKLYETMKDMDQAAGVYSRYLQKQEEEDSEATHEPQCYRFLAEYYLDKQNLDDAYNCAQMCLEFDSVKEDAKAVLRKISQIRSDESAEGQSPRFGIVPISNRKSLGGGDMDISSTSSG